MTFTYTIRIATPGDLRSIRSWLKRWHDRSLAEHNGSFFLNYEGVIKEARSRDELYVLTKRKTRSVLAYRVASTASPWKIDILEVHPEHQRLGLASELVRHYVDQARELGAIGVYVDCKPRSSIPFWERMGFMDVSADTKREDRYALLLPTLNPAKFPEGETQQVRFTSSFYGENPKLVLETIASVQGDRFVLRDEFICHMEPNSYIEVRVGQEVLYNYKVKNIYKVGGDRDGFFVRVRELHRKRERNEMERA